MYLATGTNAAVGASKSPLILTGGTAVVLALREYWGKCEGARTSEADAVVLLRRSTAAGTSSAVTPGVKSGGSHPAAEGVAGSECTVEPTYAAGQVFREPFHPASRFLWQAINDLSRVLVPLTASNGLGWQCSVVGGGAGILGVNACWNEE
jgi:hypothetical protein